MHHYNKRCDLRDFFEGWKCDVCGMFCSFSLGNDFSRFLKKRNRTFHSFFISVTTPADPARKSKEEVFEFIRFSKDGVYYFAIQNCYNKYLRVDGIQVRGDASSIDENCLFILTTPRSSSLKNITHTVSPLTQPKTFSQSTQLLSGNEINNVHQLIIE